jgi:hypothetical protein
MQPCSHSHAHFTTTSNTPLPFDRDGKIYWYAYTSASLDYHEQMAAFAQAFESWNDHFHPLRFVQATDPRDAYILIRFSGLRMSILAELITSIFPYFKKYFTVEPFPMDDLTLAYAFGAGPGRLAGHLYINSKHDWSSGPYSLTKVMIHELGHCANIGHTEMEDDIMYEVYRPDAEITQDSIDAVNHLYSSLKTKVKNAIASRSGA